MKRKITGENGRLKEKNKAVGRSDALEAKICVGLQTRKIRSIMVLPLEGTGFPEYVKRRSERREP